MTGPRCRALAVARKLAEEFGNDPQSKSSGKGWPTLPPQQLLSSASQQPSRFAKTFKRSKGEKDVHRKRPRVSAPDDTKPPNPGHWAALSKGADWDDNGDTAKLGPAHLSRGHSTLAVPKSSSPEPAPVTHQLAAVNDTRSPSPPVLLPAGLVNLGNTCYMNAVIQVLFGLPCFVADLNSSGIDQLGLPDGNLCSVLRSTFAEMTAATDARGQGRRSGASVQPDALRAAMALRCPQWRSTNQEDAHEFMTSLMHSLEAEVLAAEAKNGEARLPLSRTACPTIRTFCGCMLVTHTCLQCGKVSEDRQQFSELNLLLPQPAALTRSATSSPVHIQHLVDEHFKDIRVLKECEDCGQHDVPHTQAGHILRLPRVLALHLKRFQLVNQVARKVNTPVDVALALQLQHLLVPDTSAHRLLADALCAGSSGGQQQRSDTLHGGGLGPRQQQRAGDAPIPAPTPAPTPSLVPTTQVQSTAAGGQQQQQQPSLSDQMPEAPEAQAPPLGQDAVSLGQDAVPLGQDAVPLGQDAVPRRRQEPSRLRVQSIGCGHDSTWGLFSKGGPWCPDGTIASSEAEVDELYNRISGFTQESDLEIDDVNRLFVWRELLLVSREALQAYQMVYDGTEEDCGESEGDKAQRLYATVLAMDLNLAKAQLRQAQVHGVEQQQQQQQQQQSDEAARAFHVWQQSSFYKRFRPKRGPPPERAPAEQQQEPSALRVQSFGYGRDAKWGLFVDGEPWRPQGTAGSSMQEVNELYGHLRENSRFLLSATREDELVLWRKLLLASREALQAYQMLYEGMDSEGTLHTKDWREQQLFTAIHEMDVGLATTQLEQAQALSSSRNPQAASSQAKQSEWGSTRKAEAFANRPNEMTGDVRMDTDTSSLAGTAGNVSGASAGNDGGEEFVSGPVTPPYNPTLHAVGRRLPPATPLDRSGRPREVGGPICIDLEGEDEEAQMARALELSVLEFEDEQLRRLAADTEVQIGELCGGSPQRRAEVVLLAENNGFSSVEAAWATPEFRDLASLTLATSGEQDKLGVVGGAEPRRDAKADGGPGHFPYLDDLVALNMQQDDGWAPPVSADLFHEVARSIDKGMQQEQQEEQEDQVAADFSHPRLVQLVEDQDYYGVPVAGPRTPGAEESAAEGQAGDTDLLGGPSGSGAAGGVSAPAAGGVKQADVSSYRLHALVRHKGPLLTAGHFVADVCHAASGQWFHYNDTMVTVTGAQRVAEDAQSEVYLLLYVNDALDWDAVGDGKVVA